MNPRSLYSHARTVRVAMRQRSSTRMATLFSGHRAFGTDDGKLIPPFAAVSGQRPFGTDAGKLVPPSDFLYIGPANSNIQFIKRFAAGALFSFSIIYPSCALLLNMGSPAFGLGSRLLVTGVGMAFTGGLMAILHRFTKGYVVSLRRQAGTSAVIEWADVALCSLVLIAIALQARPICGRPKLSVQQVACAA